MVIAIREYRALDINTTDACPDDALLVTTERGTPIFLSFVKDKGSCLRRWRYIKEAMFPVDAEQVERIVNKAAAEAPAIEQATISVYAGLHIRLDMPLVCQVEAVWPNWQEKGHKRQLGTFKSGGGLVVSVTAVTIPVRA